MSEVVGEPKVRLRDAGAARRRILDAAAAEFAEFGVAGARVDRVAAGARIAKERIYAYFGSKEKLFDAVYAEQVRAVLAAVEFDADDLPGYAVRMSEYFATNPAAQRLTTWYRLERAAGPGHDANIEANATRLAALADAQARGRLTTAFDPVELLSLVQAIAASWGTMNPEFEQHAAAVAPAARRRAVETAVARLTAPR